MSEKKFKLQVPAEPPEGFIFPGAERKEGDARPAYPEYLSQGNLAVDIKLGGRVETPDERFADYLVREYGMEIVERPDETEEETPVGEDQNPLEAAYPADFPRRDVLIENNIPFETAKELTREELIAIKGIGEKSADAIIEFISSTGGDE